MFKKIIEQVRETQYTGEVDVKVNIPGEFCTDDETVDGVYHLELRFDEDDQLVEYASSVRFFEQQDGETFDPGITFSELHTLDHGSFEIIEIEPLGN
ncbi:hypothetical protein [Paenibacillus ehimensis]|uniref:hypothetical protein n=1 Tax=Paenibacillus ehimensis TaxID=79264 RepID=UPI000FDA2873|nr:hypothetical protein [Paenibacillus ehimensis]